MKVFVGQIYIQPGINFPFSHEFQMRMGEELTKLVKPSNSFLKSYSDDFDVIFRLSAKAEITETEIKGPTVFKKDNDIEFTIFLPYEAGRIKVDFKQTIRKFLNGVAVALKSLAIDETKVMGNSLELVEKFASNKLMFKQ